MAQKPAGHHRLPYFYLDFVAGCVLTLILVCFVFGQWKRNEITFLDSFLGSSYRKVAAGILAGMFFNTANILIASGTAVGGMSVSFPVSFGVTMLAFGLWNGFTSGTDAMAAFAAAALGLVGTFLASRAYGLRLASEPRVDAAASASAKGHSSSHGAPAHRKTAAPRSSWKVIVVSGFGGLLMAAVLPLFEYSKDGPIGIPVYLFLFFFALGVLLSGLVLVPGLMYFPIDGNPGRFKDYLRSPRKVHGLGLGSGSLWGIGAAALFLALGVSKDAINTSAGTASFLSLASPVLAGLAGIGVQRDYNASGASARTQAFLAILVLGLSVAVLSFVKRPAA